MIAKTNHSNVANREEPSVRRDQQQELELELELKLEPRSQPEIVRE